MHYLYLWRAIDHDGEMLESYVTKARHGRRRVHSVVRSADLDILYFLIMISIN